MHGAKWNVIYHLSMLHIVTGIGKSIAFRLARQGLNVVLVALDDNHLDNSFEEIKSAYPQCQFRKVWYESMSVYGGYGPPA